MKLFVRPLMDRPLSLWSQLTNRKSTTLFNLFCSHHVASQIYKNSTSFIWVGKNLLHSNAQGKMDTETNFVVTVGFMTKVDHQTTLKKVLEVVWRSTLVVKPTVTNENCLGVCFALCVIKALRLPLSTVLGRWSPTFFFLHCCIEVNIVKSEIQYKWMHWIGRIHKIHKIQQ